jgi:hypothetical protein
MWIPRGAAFEFEAAHRELSKAAPSCKLLYVTPVGLDPVCRGERWRRRLLRRCIMPAEAVQLAAYVHCPSAQPWHHCTCIRLGNLPAQLSAHHISGGAHPAPAAHLCGRPRCRAAAADQAQGSGASVQAYTMCSLLGSADWVSYALRFQEQLVKSDALVGVLSRLRGRGLLPRFVIDEVHQLLSALRF